MAFERIELDVNANGVMKTFHTKQFDVGRPIILDLVNGDDAYTPAAGVTFELHCRKVDDNIVIINTYDLDGNTLTFASTEQLTACIGKNLATVKMFLDEMEIGTMNFFLDVTIDPDFQGLTSETQIETLYDQVEEITQQVIGDDYYDKTEVDDLLDAKANASDVYTKSQADDLLNAKANASDVYTKSQADDLLNAKANASDVYTKSQTDDLLNAKANASDVYTKTQVDNIILDIMPVDTANGPIATFNTALATPLVNVSSNVLATGGNGTPDNPNPIVGYSSANITRCGVNLWDEEIEEGYIDSSGNELPSNISARSKNFCACKSGEEYRVYKGYEGGNPPQLCWYDINKNFISRETGAVLTATAPSNAYFFKLSMYGMLASVNHNVGVNFPSTDTSYHAYNGTTVTIAFGQTVYGGVLDVTRGKLHVTNSRIDMGVLGWLYNSGQHRMYAVLNGSKMPTDVNMLANIVCEIYKTDTFYHVQVNDSDLIIGGLSSGGYSFVTVYDSNYTDSATFTTAVTGKYIVYELATPFDIDLTPVQIRALVGENNVYSDTNGNTTVQFKDSIQHYIDTKVGS